MLLRLPASHSSPCTAAAPADPTLPCLPAVPPADASFRNLTRPAVEKDAGVIIEPIRFSKAMAQHGEQAGKNAKRAPVTVVAGGMPKKSRKR